MSLPRRTRLPPDQRRAQLLALGVDMLATRTLDQLSVDELAEQAGISRGLLFHYFRTKADFHLQVVRAAADDLIERTRPDPAWAPPEALSRSLAAFVDYVSNNKHSYLTLLRGAASSEPALRAVFDDTRAALTERVIASLVDLGVAVDTMTRLAVRGWVAFVEETTVAWLAQGHPSDAADSSAPGGGAAAAREPGDAADMAAAGEPGGGADRTGRDDLLALLARALPALVLGADELPAVGLSAGELPAVGPGTDELAPG